METIGKRIDMIIRHLGIKKEVFAMSIDENASWVSRAVNPTNPSSPEFERVAKIYKVYPQFNPHWILTGEGEMLNISIEKNLSVQQNNSDGDNNHYIMNVGECNEKLQSLQNEVKHLRKEIELKDKIISLLESKN